MSKKGQIYIWEEMTVLVVRGGEYPFLHFSDGRKQRTELSPSQFRGFYTYIGDL